jgi:hypothetical protein
VFSENGRVSATTERGNTSIALLKLNQPALISDRKRAAKQLEMQFRTLLANWVLLGPTEEAKATDAIELLVADDQEFAGMKRQVITRLRDKLLQ